MKICYLLVLSFLVFALSACTNQSSNKGIIDHHATMDNVLDCLDNYAGESHDAALERCKREICQDDTHCYEEVEEFSETHAE